VSITLEQLEDFHRFARAKLGNGGAGSISDLALEWQVAREREEVNQALREATEDLKCGRFRPAADVSRDVEQKFNLPD
jgi:hypothetical protein